MFKSGLECYFYFLGVIVYLCFLGKRRTPYMAMYFEGKTILHIYGKNIIHGFGKNLKFYVCTHMYYCQFIYAFSQQFLIFNLSARSDWKTSFIKYFYQVCAAYVHSLLSLFILDIYVIIESFWHLGLIRAVYILFIKLMFRVLEYCAWPKWSLFTIISVICATGIIFASQVRVRFAKVKKIIKTRFLR